MKTDTLTRDDMTSTPAKKAKPRKMSRWVVMFEGRVHRCRLYSYAQARRLAARGQRKGLDCYAAFWGHIKA